MQKFSVLFVSILYSITTMAGEEVILKMHSSVFLNACRYISRALTSQSVRKEEGIVNHIVGNDRLSLVEKTRLVIRMLASSKLSAEEKLNVWQFHFTKLMQKEFDFKSIPLPGKVYAHLTLQIPKNRVLSIRVSDGKVYKGELGSLGEVVRFEAVEPFKQAK